MIYKEDTIAAISTPSGLGGIAIVRMSGARAIEIACRVFERPNGKSFAEARDRSINYGHIRNDDGEILDEVLVSKMLAPHTFTTEDIVEINCHGGLAAASAVLALLCTCGARLAEGGEFTKRAFLHGRIDLSQAEAVSDMIYAKTARAAKAAAAQLGGGLRSAIEQVTMRLLQLLSELEVSIQYPEYDVPDVTEAQLLRELSEIDAKIMRLIATHRRGEILREGFKLAIAGKPNVGKSMLLNRLTDSERAIVTPIAGTTRDTIEQYISIEGIPVCLIDTAGIRESADFVESIGITRSRAAIEAADAVLFVSDISEPLTGEDISVLESLGEKPVIYALNKADIAENAKTAAYFAGKNPLALSALTGANLNELYARIAALAQAGESENAGINVNTRHKVLLESAHEALKNAHAAIAAGYPSDLISVDIEDARASLGAITGETAREDIVDEIFKNYCLGK